MWNRIKRTCSYGSCALMLALISSCKDSLSTSSALLPAPTPTLPLRSKPLAASPERQAYESAVNDYNDFIEHPRHHVYRVVPKERGLELCYLSAQVLATSVRVPEFAADLNSEGEIREWRRWVDIRRYSLNC
jgi:hypothetical protein